MRGRGGGGSPWLFSHFPQRLHFKRRWRVENPVNTMWMLGKCKSTHRHCKHYSSQGGRNRKSPHRSGAISHVFVRFDGKRKLLSHTECRVLFQPMGFRASSSGLFNLQICPLFVHKLLTKLYYSPIKILIMFCPYKLSLFTRCSFFFFFVFWKV